MDWDKLRVFHAAVEAGSLTHAGNKLHLSQSAISRQVTALEVALGYPLFHRHARGLKLTEHGELLHESVRKVMTHLAIAEARLKDLRDEARGLLRISCDAAFGSFWLSPRLAEFHHAYPEISLVLQFDGGDADLAMGEADVAICMSLPRKSGVVQRRILSTRAYAYASSDYLRRHGTPTGLRDLARHRVVAECVHGTEIGPCSTWLFADAGHDGAAKPVAMLDSTDALYRAIAAGLGIGALPHFAVPDREGLVRVLPDEASPRIDGYFLYPEVLKRSKRVAVFRDFLIRKIAESRLSLDPAEIGTTVMLDQRMPRNIMPAHDAGRALHAPAL